METPIGDRLKSLETNAELLREGNLKLAADVRGLTAAIVVVNKLQQEQREIERRNRETAETVERVRLDNLERQRRASNALRTTVGGLLLVVTLCAALMYASLLSHVNQLLAEQRAGSYNSCNTRNEGTRVQVRREEALAAAETDPTLKQVHAFSASQLQKTLVDCSRFAPIRR